MLGKLLKHEIKSYGFSMGITFLAALIFTVLMKIMCLLPYHNDFQQMIQVMSFYLFFYGIVIVAYAAQILILVRFYTTMVGDRGYLTWTLPAKSSTILWSKIIGGCVWYTISLVVIVLCFILFIIGGYWELGISDLGEFVEDIPYIFSELAKAFRIEYLIPVVLMLFNSVVWSMCSFMIYYLCIAIGQLFGKWRIIASIGAYFVYMFIAYVFSIILMFMVMGSILVFENMIGSHPFAFFNILLAVMVLIGCGVYAGIFAITNRIFDKHLNLE